MKELTTKFKCEDCEFDIKNYVYTETSISIELHKLNHIIQKYFELKLELERK